MLKGVLYRVSLGLVGIAALGASVVVFAQDNDEAAASAGRPLKARSIRPFLRDEQPTNKAPNLYDKTSDEFDYFREELGRQETSTKTKKRLAEINSRVVYADPMDKPAYDGSPFVNIYDDILNDGQPFEDPEDPDVMYSDDENNLLVVATEAFNQGTALLTALTGVTASTGANPNGTNAGYGMTSIDPEHPMPDMGDGRIMVSVGPMPNGPQPTPPGGGPGASKEPAKTDDPSSHDDTKLIFPNDPEAESQFKAEFIPIADEAFDFFKADREFKPSGKSANSGKSSGDGKDGGGPGVPDMGGGYPDDVTFK